MCVDKILDDQLSWQSIRLTCGGSAVRVRYCPPKKNELLSTKSSFFFYPSRRLGISSPHKVRCISSAPLGLYLITRQRVFFLRLDEMQHCVLMICNSFGIDDIQGFALICLWKSSIIFRLTASLIASQLYSAYLMEMIWFKLLPAQIAKYFIILYRNILQFLLKYYNILVKIKQSGQNTVQKQKILLK